VSKKAGRAGKYAGEARAIVKLSGQANKELPVLDFSTFEHKEIDLCHPVKKKQQQKF
jgi:hypothetical protein